MAPYCSTNVLDSWSLGPQLSFAERGRQAAAVFGYSLRKGKGFHCRVSPFAQYHMQRDFFSRSTCSSGKRQVAGGERKGPWRAGLQMDWLLLGRAVYWVLEQGAARGLSSYFQ